MRRARSVAISGLLGVALGLAACGDEPTRGDTTGTEPTPVTSVARDIGDSSVMMGWAEDINAAGDVVGYGSLRGSDGTVNSALLWTSDGSMRDLGRLPGTTGHSMAGAINDRGDVVGVSGNRAFLWSQGGGMRDLGLPDGATFVVPLDVSEDGRVVGAWYRRDGTTQPFLWTPASGMRDLPLPSSIGSANARGVNSHGQAAGYGCLGLCSNDATWHALVWSASGDVLDLGQRLGVSETYAIGITDGGVVAGTLRRASGSYVAFTWSAGGGLRELGTLPGATLSWALAIGEGGHVVGYSGDRAFVWTAHDGMRDLGRLPGDRPQSAVQATGINRLGKAVGTIRIPDLPRPVRFETPAAP